MLSLRRGYSEGEFLHPLWRRTKPPLPWSRRAQSICNVTGHRPPRLNSILLVPLGIRRILAGRWGPILAIILHLSLYPRLENAHLLHAGRFFCQLSPRPTRHTTFFQRPRVTDWPSLDVFCPCHRNPDAFNMELWAHRPLR